MNNRVNICQNINMIIFLIVLVILISLILINKKVKFAIDFSIIGFEYNFCVNINYFFDIITLYKEDLLKYKNNIKKQKNYSSKIIDYKWIIKHINFERINFETKIGLADVFFTSMAIPIVSSTFAIVLQKYFPTSTKTFSVKPVYNKLFLSTKGAIYVSIKLKEIIYIIFKLWKISKEKNVEKVMSIKNTKKSNIIYDN
ncbi:MAG: hypothetical protein J6C46_06055 [Clostridia bacterium]|nr:hypothetical protein [Clostridia bacterium]